MSGSQHFTCSPTAYCTAAMHALKHPTQPVVGLLLGRRAATTDAANGASSSASSSSGLHADAAVPLIHTELATAPHPVTSIAIKQVMAVSRANGSRVVGIYVANERLDDDQLHEHTGALITYLAQQVGSTLTVWLLDNRRLQPQVDKGEPTPAVKKIYTAELVGSVGSKGTVRVSEVGQADKKLTFAQWNPDTLAASTEIATKAALQSLAALVDARRLAAVSDFEDHLEDCANDYFNPWVEAALKSA
jgi:hypothetical protein